MAGRTGRVVIIGAGHNGLVAAFYLAKAGFSPLVLERREIVGGVAATEEIYPGFKCPAIFHTAGPFSAGLLNDLGLWNYGRARSMERQNGVLAIHPDGRVLRIFEKPELAAAQIVPTSPRDAEKYPEFCSCLKRLGETIRPLLSATPPDVDRLKADDYLNLGKVGLKFRKLEKKDAYQLLRWVPMPVADLIGEWFEDELLRATIAARGIFGSFAGPRSAGTSTPLLMQAALGDMVGVVDGLPEALEKAASSAGAEIRTKAGVRRIRVENENVATVVLENGKEIAARAVIASTDPRRTFFELVDPTDLNPGFLSKVRAYRSTGVVAKVNIALSGLPMFSAMKGSNDLHLWSRIHIGPDIDYLERAFDSAKYGEFSARPYMEISIPSLLDRSVAPKDAHVMSVHVQYAPYHLRSGDWNTQRDKLGDAVVNTLAEYIPNIRDVIVHRQVITPLDMEQTYGLTGGHVFHGEHALDQLFAFRPFLGWAQYRTPIKGLYLCGSGTHPGGGITGLPGANASRQIIKDLKSRG